MLVADHEHHTATSTTLAERQLGLAGHAAFETFSVLATRDRRAIDTYRTLGVTLEIPR